MFFFVSQFFKDVRHTGSVWPSSRHLAQVMTKSLRAHPGPKRLLEVGPGTGAFTTSILESLRPGDEFDIVEINPQFCARLEEKLLRPYRAGHQGVAVSLHCGPVQSVRLAGRFDYIVCGLPFNNFPPALVRAIFRRLIDLLAPQGELSYFEYCGVRTVKSPFVSAASRRRLKTIGATGRVLSRRHAGERELVIGNFPPAFSVRLRQA
jgi:phospholipid N-methyltransferase